MKAVDYLPAIYQQGLQFTLDYLSLVGESKCPHCLVAYDVCCLLSSPQLIWVTELKLSDALWGIFNRIIIQLGPQLSNSLPRKSSIQVWRVKISFVCVSVSMQWVMYTPTVHLNQAATSGSRSEWVPIDSHGKMHNSTDKIKEAV